MNYKKGDLILVNSLEDNKTTCVIVGVFSGAKYVYCYCIDDNLYKLIYHKEIECLLAEDFVTDLPDSDLWDVDYSFNSACIDSHSYFPIYTWPDDDDDTEEK